ncbi:phosphoglycolate phosphatase [Aestuariicella hydrocarbonica]|uniref:Phosphoglycolate phosphatase n=2 Tax=Pseudomaricurvus hydrocarbonicus TaxID=1470433 RepID=A0A9E5JXR0_9GAMM|nr:phosphoglycolate phosphatase [Aestuariicella hydrocarbonica]
MARHFLAQFGGRLPELVMFDLDGTLVDSVPDLTAAVDAMLLEQHCPAAGVDKVRLWVGNGAAMLVRRALADTDGIKESEVAEPLHSASLRRFLHHYGRLSGHYSRLYPGVKAALQLLSEMGVAMALVTNKPGEFVPHLLRDLGIDGYFVDWLGGDSLPQKKPDPAPLRHLLVSRSVDARRSLMVGDSRSDIQAGKAAGVSTLGVTYGYNHGQPIAVEAPDWQADNLEDFFHRVVRERV